MESPRGDETSVRPEFSLAMRARETTDVPIRGFFDAAQAPRATTGRAEASGDPPEPRVVWRTPAGTRIAAFGASAICVANGPDRFSVIRERARALFDSLANADLPHAARPRLFGGFSFFTDAHDGPWEGVPDARFVLPRAQVVSTDGRTWLTVCDEPGSVDARLDEWRDRLESAADSSSLRSPSIAHAERTTSRAAWFDQVATALSRIESGALEKVVLAQSLSAGLDRPVSVPETLSRLIESYPDCFTFAVPPGESSSVFVGATPERLVSLRGRAVETGALAGSVERGETDAEDDRLASALAGSEKNDHEHSLVAETIRDQLGPLSASVTVGERRVRKLATVQHLFTPIRAALAEDEHVLSLVEALHPTPAVGGLPPSAAAETIHEIESFDRGWYAAPVGWFDADGDGTFAVAIRSAVVHDEHATLFAGNGIVSGSDPAEEWDEVQLKYRPMLDALGL